MKLINVLQPALVFCHLILIVETWTYASCLWFFVATVRAGDGGQVGPAAFTGGGSWPGQGGAAQPAWGGEEVGARTSSSSASLSIRPFNVKEVALVSWFFYQPRRCTERQPPALSVSVWQKSGRSAVSCWGGLHHQRGPGGNVLLYKLLLN